MTSRPSLGVQQRPPQQHKLSGPNLSQRPPGVHPPPSPVRKDAAFHGFSPADSSSDGGQVRPAVPRRGGSRLKLELSHDPPDPVPPHAAASDPPSVAESSKPLTPSRVMPPVDSSDLEDVSPHLSTHPQSVEPDAPLPMPRRRVPLTAGVAPRQAPSPTTANSARKDNRPKPFSLEPPAAAPRYSATHGKGRTRTAGGLALPSTVGYADFFPWTGNHPEDQFSETVIRQGYYDKGQFSTTETQSAKGILFPALKHKTGLTALSSVFTAVLGQRRHNGQITAPSTFRPPPRVTLTDTKRELWLKDLANPSIPLRRLSRTIPHGIRGRLLLEQCLSKRVPTDRAVWLIKCVGANEISNEIRATRRKGVSNLVMGGETRWIRDWTVSVEQFTEQVYFSFDDHDWKPKVYYTTRLAAHLYAEHLLDREHYAEWLVSNLENSSDARLPMWMLTTQLYWKDLLKLRKYGRRLVAALISHHHLICNNPDKDVLQPLLENLTQCLNALILTSPESFLSPSTWLRYRDALQASLPAGDEARQNAFGAINLRNEQLAASANRSQPAARHILMRMLDGTLQTPMPAEFSAQCWDVSKDKAALARALLEWCTSPYRPGLAKIYVATRILQNWSALGLDPTNAVLDLLDANGSDEQQPRRAALYHVVCELVRAGTFSVSRYVQWLIARGGVRNPDDVLPDGPVASRLLAEIPTHCLTAPQRDLRSGMLRRASFSVADEAQNTELAIKHLKHTLGMPLDHDDPVLHRRPLSVPKLRRKIASASRALKAEIGCWLRSIVAAYVGEKDKEGHRAADISPAVFYTVRSVLEAAEDFTMLGDVMKELTKLASLDILATITDTVSRHFLIFSALGDSLPLFRDLHQRLRTAAREQGLACRPLLASLVALAPRIPGMEELASQLQRDLALSDRQNPVDACSPVSDNMVVRLQDDAAELHEEIEKLLASGSSVDRNTMERLFQTIVQRLQASWGKAPDKERAYSTLLSRLRVFHTQQFDGLMFKWLLFLRTLGTRPSVLKIFPLLVSVGCVDLGAILATASEVAAGQAAGTARPPVPGPAVPQVVQVTYRTRYMQEVLQLLTASIPQDDLLTADEVYRFSVLQEQAVRDFPKQVLGLVFLASAEYTYARSQNDLEALPLDSGPVQDNLVTLLRCLVLRDATAVARALGSRSSDPHVRGWIDSLTNKLLITSADDQTHFTFDQVLERTNELTLPFCQVKLALSLSLSANEHTNQEAADRQQSHVELFANAMDKAIGAGNISWVGMLGCLSPDITQHLKARAQSRFLELLPSLRSPPGTEAAALARDLQMAENLLAVVDAIMRGDDAPGPGIGAGAGTSASSAGTRQPQPFPPAVVDRLIDLWEVLASSPDKDEAHHPNQVTAVDAMDVDTDTDTDSDVGADVSGGLDANAVDPKAAVLNHWLPLALNFVTLHAAQLSASSSPAAAATQSSLDSPSSKPPAAAVSTGDARAKILVVCAGLLQQLDALDLPAVGEMIGNPASTNSGTAYASASAAAAGVSSGVGAGAGAGFSLSSGFESGARAGVSNAGVGSGADGIDGIDSIHGGRSGSVVQALSRRVFDLACLLVDGLSEEARATCVRAVAGACATDARLRYIFSVAGSSPAPATGGIGIGVGDADGMGSAAAGGSFMLCHRERAVAGPGSAAGGGKAGNHASAAASASAAAAAAAAAANNTTSATAGGAGGASGTPVPATTAAAAGSGGTTTTTTTTTGNPLFSGLLGTPASLWGFDRGQAGERLSPFVFRRWEALSEPTPNVGVNDTALSLALFEARRVQ